MFTLLIIYLFSYFCLFNTNSYLWPLGVLPTADISPTSGQIYFVTGQTREIIILNILPDDESEGMEVREADEFHVVCYENSRTCEF